MSNFENYKSEIDQWVDIWDEMQKKSVHPEPEKLVDKTDKSDFVDDNPRDDYFSGVFSQELFTEEEYKVPNPVRVDTKGPDNKKPDPVWVSEDLLPEIEKLKDRLFNLENEMASLKSNKKTETPVHMDLDMSKDDLSKKISSIRDEIEKVSSQLGIKNEPSSFSMPKK